MRSKGLLALAAAVLVVHVAWIAFFLAGSGHEAIDFVHIGMREVVRSQASAAIAAEAHDPHVTEVVGNDGQFSYYLAVDPANAGKYADDAAYRYSRFLYPLVVRVAALGRPGLVPVAMIAVNLIAVVAGTLAVGAFLARRGVTPWLALFYGFFPGTIISLRYDFPEPMVYGLVAVGAYLFHFGPRPRWLWSAVAFGLAALTRETAALFAVGYLGALLLSGCRPTSEGWRRALGFAAIAFGPILAAKALILAWLGTAGTGPGLALPFAALLHPQAVSCVPDCGPILAGHIWAEVLIVVIPALIAFAVILVHVRRKGWTPEAANLVSNTLLYVVFVNKEAFLGFVGSLRFSLAIVMAALLCLPAVTQLGHRAATAARVVGAIWLASAPIWLARSAGLLPGP